MLNALRKGAKSLVAKALIGLLVASFAVWGIGDIFSFRLDSRVAKVGETEVSAQRFADALSREQARLTRQAGQIVSIDMMRAAGLDRRVLGGLIRDAAFAEELGALGIEASDSAVADAIRQNSSFQDPSGRFSQQAYSLLLAQQGFSAPEFEALTRTLLGQQILIETAEAALAPAPGAGARIAAYQGESRGVNMLALNLDMAPDPGTPDEGALRAFYDANPALFTEPERRWGEFVHVDAEKLRAELTPDEATLRAAYDAEIDNYTVPETRLVDQVTIPDRAAAEAAMGQLVGGAATFESLATEFGLSEADLALGKVTPADLPEAAAAAVFGEAEPGIIGPVELPVGFAVYRIREITPGGATPFEDVRDQIADRLARQEVTVRAPERANRVEELRAEGLPMPEIATGAGVSHGSFEGLARDGSLPGGARAEGVAASPAFVSEAFAALDAEERDLVETPDGGYLLIMVRRIEPSALKPLDEIRDSAIALWQDAERLKAIEARGAELSARLGEETSAWDLGDELGVAVLPVPPFTRMAPPPTLPGTLVDAIFRANSLDGVSGAGEDGKTVIVGQIASVNMPGPEALASANTRMESALTDSLQKDMAEYFARAVEAQHEAQIEPGVIEEVYRRLGAASTGGQ
jgi:peptidyl-prolyl cis-trans isomerase D